MSETLLDRLCAEMDAPVQRDLNFTSLHSLADSLRLPRRSARKVELDVSNLAHLALPALIVLDGQLALIRQVRERRVLVEHASGATSELTRDQAVERSRGMAVELLPSLLTSGSFVHRLLDFFGSRGADLAKVGACAVLVSLLGLTTPLVTGMVVDRALPERTPKLLTLIAFVVLFVASQRALFTWLERRLSLALHARLQAAVATSLFDHLLRIPYGALIRETVGSWLETLSGARRVESMFSETLLLPLLHLTMGLVQAIALLQLCAPLGASVMLGSFVLLAASLSFAFRASRLERRLIDASSREHSTLFEVLEGLPTLRTSGAQQRGVMRWLDRALALRIVEVRMDLLLAASRSTIGAARDIVCSGAFVWAAHACLEGQLSVGAVLSISMLTDRFVSVVVEFAGVLAPLFSARSHLARVDALLAHENVVDKSTHAAPASRGDAVVLEDVWFRYGPEQPWVLEGYSLRVHSLEHFELRGPSGMGKSTILRLIAGLYTAERGSVRVFGQRPQQLRGQICYLPQDARLLSGSIMQNLRLLSGACNEAIEQAAARSGLAELVQSLPMGYETVLPAGANTLSGGQRQLIAWTAAMASERKLLLMDEALSSVDPLLRVRLLAMARSRACTIVAVEHERTTGTLRELVSSARTPLQHATHAATPS
jgi:ATP-binding cassette, subfamily B, bacterial